MTRYALLRESIAYFAASPADQLAHDLGPDDAVNETPYPLEHMLECGEITPAEIGILRPLEELIERYCVSGGLKPWHDEAMLFSDPHWAQIRSVANEIIHKLPDEERESDFTRSLKK